MSVQTQDDEFSAPRADVDYDEIDLRSSLALLLESGWLIAGVTTLFAAIALVYSFLAEPVYRADALLQVEEKSQGLSGLSEFPSMLGATTPAVAEVEIIRSRSIIGPVVDRLKLDIRVDPVYFPVVGKAIARVFSRPARLSEPLLGMDSFAWGGEVLKLDRLDVPRDRTNDLFTLEVGEGETYTVTDGTGQTLVEGRSGTTASTADGEISLFVSDLRARPGTRFIIAKSHRDTVIAQIQQRLKVVEKGKGTGILQILLEGGVPSQITTILETISIEYLRQNVERRSEEARSSLSFVSEQLPILKANLDSAEAQLNEYRISRGAVDLDLQTQNVLEQITSLERQLSDLNLERSELARRFTENHPVFVALGDRQFRLQTQLKTLEDRILELPAAERDYVSLARNVQVANELYVLLLNKAQELQVVQAGTVGNVRILDPAIVFPRRPIRPNRTRALAYGVAFGLFAGVLLVFLLRALRNTVTDPADIEKKLGLPVYATIPNSQAQTRFQREFSRRKNSPAKILAIEEPKDIVVESFRSLRTSLEFSLLDARAPVIMVGGPSPEVGKSFVSVNLAFVIASADKKVLLIDADMRRGHLHRYFGTTSKPGLSSLLAGHCDDAEALRPQPAGAGVDFMPAGEYPPNPSELLMGVRFAEFMARATAAYDVVIVDTPPILAVTDGLIVGKHSGVNLMVLRAGRHTAREIGAARDRFQSNGVAVHGAVMNDLQRAASGYGGYYYYEYKGSDAR